MLEHSYLPAYVAWQYISQYITNLFYTRCNFVYTALFVHPAYICKGGVMYIWNYLDYKPDLNSNKHSQIITHGIYIHIHILKYINPPVITWPLSLEYKDCTICKCLAYISSLYTITSLDNTRTLQVQQVRNLAYGP